MAVQKDDDEFIITGFQLRHFQKYDDLDFVCRAILGKKIHHCYDSEMRDRDAAIRTEAAKAAREQVLKEQQDYWVQNSVQEETLLGFRYVIDAVAFNTRIEKELESLRSQQEQPLVPDPEKLQHFPFKQQEAGQQ